MLRSVQDLGNFRIVSADGANCGRVKDIYFDDQTWTIRYLVVALEPRRFGQKQVLIEASQVESIDFARGNVHLRALASDVKHFRLAVSVLPVCRQYASLAMASPGARGFQKGLHGVDPHLRSARTVITYQLNVAGETAGTLSDMVWDEQKWEIRYLAVEQIVLGRSVKFHVLPQCVERFTWSTQRVLLRDLQPVELAADEPVRLAAAAA